MTWGSNPEPDEEPEQTLGARLQYFLFGWWYRWQACKLAALAVNGWNNGPDAGLTPRLWSVTVFFKSYMIGGSARTREDFGPSAPVELTVVGEANEKA